MNLTSCKKCGECCKGSMGPFVFPSDVERISHTMNISEREFLKEYCQKNVLSVDDKNIIIFSAKHINGSCIFLTEQHLCKIYTYRPYQCVNAPYNFMSQSGFWSHMKCIDYSLLQKCNSQDADKTILSELIEKGYKY